MIIPGVQKPHCNPCFSLKPSCNGCSAPFWATPSMVLTSRPSTWTANTVQDFTGLPSRRIVHAPQLVVSQPMRSEEHTSELQSPDHLVCRLLLEKKTNKPTVTYH